MLFRSIIFGITLLLLRWVFPKIRLERGKQILYAILILIVLWCSLTLSALYGGKEVGGDLGMTYVRWLTSTHSAGQVSFLLWVLLILSICLLAGGTKWMPELFRALGREVKTLASDLVQKNKEKPAAVDPSEFDWQAEFKSSEDAAKKRIQEERIERLRKEETEEESIPVNSVSTPVKKIQDSIPAFFTKKRTMEEKNIREVGIRSNIDNNNERKTVSESNPLTRSKRLPPLNLLDTELGFYGQNADHSQFIADIEEAMEEFGTPIHVIGCSVGPSVVQYQVVPGSISKPGKDSSKNIRVSQVAQTERDLAVRLGVSNLSIQAPVPGEAYIGIDIPNPQTMKVRLRPLIESPEFQRKRSPLTIALGRNITGDPVVVDLGSMPHLLVAGTTNSGKSICLRSIAICLAMNNTPEQLRFVMIDPKRDRKSVV